MFVIDIVNIPYQSLFISFFSKTGDTPVQIGGAGGRLVTLTATGQHESEKEDGYNKSKIFHDRTLLQDINLYIM
jgi:hypothetical protein